MAKRKKNTPINSNTTRYAQILILKSRRNRIMVAFCLMLLTFMSILMTHIFSNLSWMSITLPIIAIGLLGLLVPQSEQWEYKPWQDRPERHEKISFEGRDNY
jgi:hypothetical protein